MTFGLRLLAVAAASAVVAAACSGGSGETGGSDGGGASERETVAVETGDPAARLAPERIESPLADDVIYMVMTDRFANGDPTNDRGADSGGVDDALRHGFDPTRTGYFHGGDLVGLTDRLDYLQGLGITAIWLTPVLRNRSVQGDGTLDGSSAGYHGYWQLDFTAIDPHLGTADDFQALVDEAHARGMKVILDVVVNHTADVISFGDQPTAFSPTTVEPYLDADGVAFDVRAVAGTEAFPPLDAAISFPLVPEALGDDAEAKAPPFLNDPTNYHNRGESTFSGESSQFGDFFGLDDLFTEKPEVVAGMIDVHTELINRFDLDGFRIDTAKHVNDEFWVEWLPAIHDTGGEDFVVFGEVVEPQPDALSRYLTEVGFASVIDMRMDDAVERFAAAGAPTDDLSALFLGDDWFTDADSNAHHLVTVISSHDFGRLGGAIDRADGERDDDERLARMRLGVAVQFLSRGTPIVYYGDEQGFASIGDDQAVREDMFPSVTPDYQGVDTIGSGATPADDNFDPTHPVYLTIAELADLRAANQGLRTGPQTVVVSGESAGIIAWTRRADDGVEYLVALNNAPVDASASAPTLSPGTSFEPLFGDPTVDGSPLAADPAGMVQISLPAFGVGVWRADGPASMRVAGDDLGLAVSEGASIFGRDVRVEVTGSLRAPAYVVFDRSVGADGTGPELVGVDDAPPYAIYVDPDDVAEPFTLDATVWIDGDVLTVLSVVVGR